MIDALTVSLYTALILAALVRASRPGELLASTLGTAWQWWLIFGRGRLPGKPTGDCEFCTAFWWVGVPVAILAAVFTPAGWAAVGIPLLVGILFEKLL